MANRFLLGVEDHCVAGHLNHAQRTVLAFYCLHATPDGLTNSRLPQAWPIKEIAARTTLDTKTITEAVRDLTARKYLIRIWAKSKQLQWPGYVINVNLMQSLESKRVRDPNIPDRKAQTPTADAAAGGL